MSLKYPVIRKIALTNDFLIERVLPSVGGINVKVNEKVEPFTRIGDSKISYFSNKIPSDYRVTKELNTYIENGISIAEKKLNPFKVSEIFAPFSGFLKQKTDGVYFEQESVNFQLFSGVYGQVLKVLEKRCALIKSSARIIYCALCSKVSCEGELVVLPNPTELIEDPYFNNFTKDISGKIIYSGYFIKLDNLKKAQKLGVRGIFAGGFDRETYEYAVSSNFFLGSLGGYGRIPTPTPIFNLLNSVASRYIFVNGGRGEIVIPSEKEFPVTEIAKETALFTNLKNGMIVQVLERPYFGWLGEVQAQVQDIVMVKLADGDEVVNVRETNLLVPMF